MGISIVNKSEVRAAILAGLVLTVRCAQVRRGDPHFIAGVLAMAEHQAVTFDLSWPALLDRARAVLGGDVGGLIDAALALEPGNGNG